MSRYLKDHSYYEDNYDLHSIEECLHWYWAIKDGFEKDRNKKQFKKFSKKEFDKEVHKVTSYTVNVISIQRYRHKADTIKEWMDKDQAIQDKYDSAIPPDEVFCKGCGASMEVTSKDLMGVYEADSQVLFMFECTKCKKRRAIYESGTEWKYEPPKCPKCNSSLEVDSKYSKHKTTSTYICKNCSYKKVDIDDLRKSDEKWKKKEVRDRKLLEEFRKDFCLDNEEGPKAVINLDNIARFVDEMKEREKKEKDPIFQKAKKLKILKIKQLKDLIKKAAEKAGYTDFEFDKPEMGKHVIVGFTASDIKDDRVEYDSCNQLKKAIKFALEDTNWRLMSEGISFRLGILSGRLKAYEHENDLMEIVRK